jgi:hypothetical protein
MESELLAVTEALASVRQTLKDKYNIEEHRNKIDRTINQHMNRVAEQLNFERYFRPLHLRFSTEKFDLCHVQQGREIYLGSMGSGANWVGCHISLFLGLQFAFCAEGSRSLVPPILFFDQPSQVYFPSVEGDTGMAFDPSLLRRGKDDLAAVTEMFDAIVDHVAVTKAETGIEPQVIVADHADNLQLKNADFETLVNGRRWRDKGMIVGWDE